MKKIISLTVVFIMLLTCFSSVGFAASEMNEASELLFYEGFDAASENVTIKNDTFSYVACPADGEEASTAAAYGALMSSTASETNVNVKLNELYQGEFIYEMDFRLEGILSTAPNEIKLIRFKKDNTINGLITLWNSTEKGYRIRVCTRKENNDADYKISDIDLSYKTWYKLRVVINTYENNYDVYVNEENVCENALPYSNSFSIGVNNVEIFTDKVKNESLLIDNIKVLRELKVTSSVYSIDEDVILGEFEGVSVEDFYKNIEETMLSKATLYSNYALKTENTGFVEDGDILEIKSVKDTSKVRLYTISSFSYTTTYYVSPTGNNLNDGLTPITAFASLDYAKSMVRIAKQKNPDTVYSVKFLSGDYKIDKETVFTAADSGSAEYPIVYEAYGNGPVNFKGSVTLHADNENISKVTETEILDTILSEDAKTKLMQIDLNALGIEIPVMPKVFGYSRSGFKPLRVYINGQALTEARFPNVGEMYIPMSSINNADTYAADGGYDMHYADHDAPLSRTSLWDTENRSIYISGTIAHEYAGNHLRVKTFDPENKRIVTDGYGGYATSVGKSYFYFANVLEEIDMPGESYVDEANGIVYFYPYDNMENATIEIGVHNDNMIKMTDADYITFKNLNFGYNRDKILETENTDYLTIDGCEFAHTGATAMTVNGTNITVKNNHIYDLAGYAGTGGIHMTGNGSRKDLITDNNKITNNKIHDTDVIYNVSQSPAIYLLDSVGTEISNNEIYNGTAYVIRITDANDILIKHNEIYNAVTMSSDAGAVTWGRDITLLGFQIIENYFHDIGNDIGIREQESTGITCKRIGQQALFHDDGSSGPYAYGNIFYQSKENGTRNTYTAIKANGGQYGIWENNIFIGGEGAAYFGSWHTGTNGKTMQDTWWLRNYNVYEADRNADGSGGGTSIYWDRISSSKLNFFENDLWKEKYKGQYGAYWTLFTQEQKTTLEAAYDSEVSIKNNQALLNAAQVHEALLADTNIMKNNILIDTLTPKEYKDTANYHEQEGSVTGIYTAEAAQGFFSDYGTDFTMTAAGLAAIQQTVPAFKAIDFSTIGIQSKVGKAQPGFALQDFTDESGNITVNIINEGDAPKTGLMVVMAQKDGVMADIQLEMITLSGKTAMEKQYQITKEYDSVTVYVLKDIITMRIFSNILK